MTVRAELVEAQKNIHISTSSMRTDSWINHADSIIFKNYLGRLAYTLANDLAIQSPPISFRK